MQRRSHCCRISQATTPPTAAADGGQKDSTEGGAEKAVDDKVARRIDDDKQIAEPCHSFTIRHAAVDFCYIQQIAEFRVVEVKASTLTLGRLEQSPEDLIEQRRSLTDDEHADDYDDTQCDVVVVVRTTTTHSVMFS